MYLPLINTQMEATTRGNKPKPATPHKKNTFNPLKNAVGTKTASSPYCLCLK